jgi:hypothetical protein
LILLTVSFSGALSRAISGARRFDFNRAPQDFN